MKILFLILFSGVCTITANAQENDYSLIPYRKGKLWGYCDSTKKILIKPQYDSVNFFQEVFLSKDNSKRKIAMVKKKGLGVIDTAGKKLILPQFERARISKYSIYKDSAYIRFVFECDPPCITREVDSLFFMFREEFNDPCVVLEKGKVRYQYNISLESLTVLDTIKKMSIKDTLEIEEPPEQKIEVFRHANYCNVGTQISINRKDLQSFYVFKTRCWQINKINPVTGSNEYKQKVDTIVIKAKNLKEIPFSEQKMFFQQESGWGLIDSSQNLLIPAIYDTLIVRSSGDYFAAKKGNKWAVIQPKDKQEALFIYDSVIINYHNGIKVKKGNKWWVLFDGLKREMIVDDDLYNYSFNWKAKLVEVRKKNGYFVGYVHYNGTKYWD